MSSPSSQTPHSPQPQHPSPLVYHRFYQRKNVEEGPFLRPYIVALHLALRSPPPPLNRESHASREALANYVIDQAGDPHRVGALLLRVGIRIRGPMNVDKHCWDSPDSKPSMGKYYAVRSGHKPGIYTSWKECLDQVRGFKGAKFKSFSTADEANLFLNGHDPSLNPASESYVAKFYGVRSGRVPGVYTDWASAEKQVMGVLKPKVRCFSTREDAEAFVKSGAQVAEPQVRELVPMESTLHQQFAGACASGTQTDSLPGTRRKAAGEPPTKKRRSIDNASPDSKTHEADSHRVQRDGQPTKRQRVPAEKNPVLRIYTDGSALGNGQDSAVAGVGVWFGEQDKRNISEPLVGLRQTNQRAELTAVLRAVDVAPMHRDVLIFTDSRYAINCVTEWHKAWIRNNWITSVGRPVENQDLIEPILKKIKEREEYGSRTMFEWVKGHTGNQDGNLQADRLALEGAKMNKMGMS